MDWGAHIDANCIGSLDNSLEPAQAELQGFMARGGGTLFVDPGLNATCIMRQYSAETLAAVKDRDPVAAYTYSYHLYQTKKCASYSEMEADLEFARNSKVEVERTSESGVKEKVSVYRVPEAGKLLYAVSIVCFPNENPAKFEYLINESYDRGMMLREPLL